ncbi:MAG: ABC transporter permease [Gemmatimonadota bacterium]|nr:MAG: ABC transporter permease [Gemmatimonadota bacterium]
MFKNYLKTAYRNLFKTKIFSLINILGLAMGMTICLLILHYVNYEKSYDRFHPHHERIYRLRYERTDEQGQSVRFASCCPPAAPRIRDRYPEVEKIGRLLRYRASVSHGDTNFFEERMYFAEPDVFEILKFSFIEGDPTQSLQDPNNAFVSQTTAKKYFGDEYPIGKTISVDKKEDYQIVGLFEDIPHNSHLKFDILLPFKKLETLFGPEYTEAWGHTGSYTYLRVKSGTDPSLFEKKLLGLVEAECPWLKEYKMIMTLPMQHLTDIHLTSHFMQEYEANGNRESVNFLMLVALFIIVMAWVNYMNLSTARALNRAKEVGLRKVVGANRRQLMIQFFMETTLINMVALIMALVLVTLSISFFSHLTSIPVSFRIWTQSWFFPALLLMFVVGIFLSGIYPVAAMSSFEPIRVLKGKIGNATKGLSLRKGLVVFQFVMALILITGTLTVYRQISFMRSQDLGFSMDQTLVVKAPRVRNDSYAETFLSFKETLLQNTRLSKISHVTEVPGRQIYWDAGGIHRAGTDISQSKNYQIVGVDYDFADVFDLQFSSGRNFSKEFSTDSDALILNETAVKWMGFENAESALGQQVDYWGDIYTIIGVLKDYHQQSPKEAFEPTIFRFMPTGRDVRGLFAIKLKTQNMREIIRLVQSQYDAFFPGNPFDYFFLDEYYDQQYHSDELFGQVFTLFSFLAVFITALGIFGLSSFSVAQRTKEVGIRKVVGASVLRIFLLLTRDYLLLLSLSFLISFPIVFFGLRYWLHGFAFRMSLNGWLFLSPFLLTACITLFTVSYQSIYAALANPVESLKYE